MTADRRARATRWSRRCTCAGSTSRSNGSSSTATSACHAEWHGRGPARSHAETEYRLTAVDGGTRFDYRNEFTAPLGPLGRVASRALVGGLPRREADASLRKLKALAERS